jgi:hypothetical protein
MVLDKLIFAQLMQLATIASKGGHSVDRRRRSGKEIIEKAPLDFGALLSLRRCRVIERITGVQVAFDINRLVPLMPGISMRLA